jgi:thiamine-phosphate pyrophosphorylase
VICCLVTDRRRLCPGTASWTAEREAVVDQARAAARAGIDFIQIRERDLDGARLAALVEQVVAVTRGSSTHVLVNDRFDVALACGADGVHLRGDSIPASAVRRAAPAGFVISQAIHAAAEASAPDVDVFVAGTVFRTESKDPGAPLLGLDGLARIVAAARVPVLAIGGVTRDRVADVVRAGAAGIAAIGMFIDSVERPP